MVETSMLIKIDINWWKRSKLMLNLKKYKWRNIGQVPNNMQVSPDSTTEKLVYPMYPLEEHQFPLVNIQ